MNNLSFHLEKTEKRTKWRKEIKNKSKLEEENNKEKKS